MTRRDGKYYKLDPVLSEDLDRKVSNLRKKADLLKEISKIINTIKANGLYSEKEMNMDLARMDEMKAPEHEKELIINAWHIRKRINNDLILECQEVLNEINKKIRKGSDSA